MKKSKFHITLITNSIKEEYNLLGEYDKENNIITYYESNKLRSKLTLDIDNKKLVKENIDYKIELSFNEKEHTTNEITLLKENKVLNLELETKEYKVSKNIIEIKYEILASNEIVEYIIEIGE